MQMQPSAGKKRSTLGHYGGGTLWFLTGREGTLSRSTNCEARNVMLTRRRRRKGERSPVVGTPELQVQRNDSDGIFVSPFARYAQ
jgi:hypothetical protein